MCTLCERSKTRSRCTMLHEVECRSSCQIWDGSHLPYWCLRVPAAVPIVFLDAPAIQSCSFYTHIVSASIIINLSHPASCFIHTHSHTYSCTLIPLCTVLCHHHTCCHAGDKLQFGLAAENAKAEGHQVEMVLVADDCSLPGQGVAGRRGIAGALLVEKVPCTCLLN